MVQSNKYYKSRAVGLMSEVGLTTDWDLAEPFVLKKHIFYTSSIPEVTWYKLLYNNYIYIYIYIYKYHHHHHYQDMLIVQNSLTLSHHPSLMSISPGRFSWLHTMSLTDQMYISLCWSANPGASICLSLKENVTFKFVLTSPAVPCMAC